MNSIEALVTEAQLIIYPERDKQTENLTKVKVTFNV